MVMDAMPILYAPANRKSNTPLTPHIQTANPAFVIIALIRLNRSPPESDKGKWSAKTCQVCGERMF
jgi:hypothetical protein